MTSLSNYEHIRAGNSLGNYNGNAFVVGGFSEHNYNYHNHAEILENKNGELDWVSTTDYPFSS